MMQNETTIEQSKKLLELGINTNTADITYVTHVDPIIVPYTEVVRRRVFPDPIPAWSLAALLKLIPNYQLQTQDDNKFGILYGCKKEIKIIEGDSPFEVVYEMVCWLLENKNCNIYGTNDG